MGRMPCTIAVPGGRGMLGTDLSMALAKRGFRVNGLDLPAWDICNPQHLSAALAGADAVINCAAFTNVDGAEGHPERADAVNHRAVGVLGQLAAEMGLYVIHVSTDFVFDGRLDRPYQETDAANPLNVYGLSKWRGEQALQASGCRHAIVRVEWTYGHHGANFVTRFLERALASDSLMMVADQVGAPTWTEDVAAALMQLLQTRAEGLFHYAAAGYASRFDVAEDILRARGLHGKDLHACRTADFPAAAERPLNSRFDCRHIDDLLSTPRRPWRVALRQFLAATPT